MASNDCGWGRTPIEDSGGWCGGPPDNGVNSFVSNTQMPHGVNRYAPPTMPEQFSPPLGGWEIPSGVPPAASAPPMTPQPYGSLPPQYSASAIRPGPPLPTAPPPPPPIGGVSLDSRGEEMMSRTLFVCKLPPSTTEDDLHAWFARAGGNNDPRKVAFHPERSIAFVEFWDIRHSEVAREASQEGIWLNFCHFPEVKVAYGKCKDQPALRGNAIENTGTIYVRPREKNVNDPNDKDAYRTLFERFGQIKSLTCNRKRESEKFIEYFDLRAASAALQSNGYNFNGIVLEVQMSKNQSKNYSAAAVTIPPSSGGYGLERHRSGSHGQGTQRPHRSNRDHSFGAQRDRESVPRRRHRSHSRETPRISAGGTGDYHGSRYVDILFPGRSIADNCSESECIDLVKWRQFNGGAGPGVNGNVPTMAHTGLQSRGDGDFGRRVG
eukprot:GHVH01004344.1.p1 GENE.GHVH01004344.1~~GHVH01004344.1.p1  ORF type:complete len:437 (+),score=32.21 GHVH01004344.1:133-1443(+)